MGTTPQFDRHVFISYAHIDNRPLSPEQHGWVTRFHESLEAMLGMRLGRKADIWRDAKLTGNDVFSEEIVAQFRRAAVLVSVLSPRYVESDWCTREVREFCEAAERTSTLVVGNKARAIKVIKTPVDSLDVLPPVMAQAIGYDFFTISDDEAPIELDPAYGIELAQKFNLKVASLAWDIAQLVKKLEASSAGEHAREAARPTVYLAECSYDRRDAREALRSELQVHGYTVLPDGELPRDELQYVTEADRAIRRADLAVHLIGSLYGSVPDGPSQKSVVVLQNELAVAQSRARGLPRVIWIPEGTEARSAEQQAFIAALHSTAEAQFGADLITGDIEVVKSMVRATLKRIEAPPPPPRAAPGAGPTQLIYLICDAADRKATVPLRRVLQQAGFEVEIPLFSGDAATVRRTHEELLAQCDGAILFYGAGDEAWRKTAENDVRKAQASRKDKRVIQRVTYLAEPHTDDKADMIAVGEPNLLDALTGELPPEAILAVLGALKGA